MEIRRATEADVPAEQEVFRAAIGELYRRHSLEPPNPPPAAFDAQQEHLLRHDGERCFVAEDAGRIVAFVAALVRADTWFLSSLFVLPELQGRRLGRRLLERAWGDGHRCRLTLTDAIQPVSNGLYTGLGLIPSTPVLHLEGQARPDAPPGLESAPTEPSALAALDRAAYGFDRAIDHSYWGAGPSRGTLWLRGGEPCAYSYLWPGGRIGPVAGVDGAAAADALRAELARAQGAPAAIVVPGSAAPLVRAAVAGGLRFGRPPGLLLLGGEAAPPTAIAISGYSLF